MLSFSEISRGHMAEISRIFTGRPSEAEVSWKTAREQAQSFGAFDAMKNMAIQLRARGDDTVELWENTSKLSSDYSLTLFFYGDNNLADAYFVLPSNRGVRLRVSSMGDKKVEYTQNDNWMQMPPARGLNKDNLPLFISAAKERAGDIPVLKDSKQLLKSKRISLE